MTKTVTRRDSATAILRKLGVKPRDYDLFITVVPGADGESRTFVVKVTEAKTYLAGLKQVEAAQATQDAAAAASADEEAPPKRQASPFDGLVREPKSKAQRAPAAKKAPKAKPTPKAKGQTWQEKDTMSNVARRLILEGKTNAEVWEIIQPRYNLDEKKKYYPGWWRFELRRKGHTGI